MTSQTLTERVPARPDETERVDRGWLGHPVAFLLTAAILFGLFGWTFFTNPGRVAPTKDPAYYTWRTEALLTETPATLLSIEGPKAEGAGGMFAGGYRVTAPVLGGLLRRIPGIATLSTTAFLMVGLPVLTALLLGAFAFQQRRDPLMFHSVALGAASLYLTPPFVGYLDNILALFFLAASLPLIESMRRSWAARIAFATFLMLCGLTHPTTLVIFCVVLGAMSVARLIYRRFDLRSVIRDDLPMLLSGFVSVVVVYAIWKIGIWGPSASLSDAALPPPYESSFFIDRMVQWIGTMRPLLNGPLFLIGAVGLLAAGRRAAEDELSRVSIVWLAPLAGLFGFIAGLTYPYYRFFNTTLAWILLVGVGIYFAARFFLGVAARGGIARLAWLGIAALIAVIATNFTTGFDASGWNNASRGWLSADERRELDGLRDALAIQDQERPVVFVVDSDDHSPRVYGYTKLAGNTSRYGLPPGWLDRAHLYLGDLENLLDGEPTSVGEDTYDAVSRATLEEANEGIEAADGEVLVVVASAFNATGANVEYAQRGTDLSGLDADVEIWQLDDGIAVWRPGAESGEGLVATGAEEEAGPAHLLRVLLGLALLLLPGALAYRWFRPGGSFGEAVGMAPALSIALLTVAGITILAIVRAPLGSGVAWATVVVGLLAGGAMWLAGGRSSADRV